MRTNVPHIFAIGDIAGPPMLAHKAVHEGHVAAEAAAGQKSYFDARVIPSVAYTDPEIAWAGLTEEEAKKQGLKFGVAKFPWTASGRAIEMGADAVDIGKTIHPHPTTSESVGMAAELYEGVCTDLPPSKRR